MTLRESYLDGPRPLQLSQRQATILALVIAAGMTAVWLAVGIGFRTSTLGVYALAGVLGLGLVAAIFVRPQVGTYALVVTVITNISDALTNLGLPSVNKPLVGLIFVSVVATRLLRHRHLLPLKRLEYFMLAYGVMQLLSSFVAEDRLLAASVALDYAKDLIILLCVVYSVDSVKGLQRAGWLVIGGAAFLALLGSYQALTGDYDQTFYGLALTKPQEVITGLAQSRLSGPVGDPNFFGQTLVAVIPLVLYRVLEERRIAAKLGAATAALIIIFAIVNTFSRGAFMALMVVLALIAVERKIRPTLFVVVAVLGLIVLQFLPAGYAERLESLQLLGEDEADYVYQDDSFRGRLSEVLSGLSMFAKHPILGVGVGNYPRHYQEYASRLGLEQRTTEREAHSLYVETAAETGLLGLTAFVAIFAAFFRGLAQARRQLAIIGDRTGLRTWITSLQFAVVGYLCTSLFLHGDYSRYLWLLVSLGAAAIHIADAAWQRENARVEREIIV